jgi:hypothetical protein
MSLRRKYVNSSLKNKTCFKCEKIFPRNEDYFYAIEDRTRENIMRYDSYCITCRNEHYKRWRRTEDGGKKKRKSDLKYRQSEQGYLMEKWHSIKKSKKGCLIQSFEEFKACWEKQKETFGEQCPYYSNIKLTRKLGRGNKDKIDSNLSVDRLVNCLPYSKDNIMFISWKANNEKGDVSYFLARKMIDFIEEKERLKLFVDMDTFDRNGEKFDIKKYNEDRDEMEQEISVSKLN